MAITDFCPDGVFVLDSWYNITNRYYSFQDLRGCLKKLTFIDMSAAYMPTLSLQLVRNSVISTEELERMESFANKICGVDIDLEYKGLPPKLSFKAPLDKALRNIIMNRQRYRSFLEYANETNSRFGFEPIISGFDLCIEKWSTLRSIFLQHYFTHRRIDYRKIEDLLLFIIGQEKYLKDRIEEML